MNKWNNKFRYQVASCWLFILSTDVDSRSAENVSHAHCTYA